MKAVFFFVIKGLTNIKGGKQGCVGLKLRVSVWPSGDNRQKGRQGDRQTDR